ncbi:MAG TPA: tetratricopeptide repeat protein [Armatimonadota bacterium]|nr:tetratricopeptide repeat protein [Armatimonadota bacterium]
MSEQTGGARDEGLRLLQSGDVEGAMSQFQQALTQNPADGRSHGLLGVCYARRGETESAIRSMQEAARLQPNDASAHYNLGLILFQSQRLPEAKAELDAALAIDPGNARAKELVNRIGAASPDVAGLAGGLAAPAPPAWGQPAPAAAPPFPGAPAYSQEAPAWSPTPAFTAGGAAGGMTAFPGAQGMTGNVTAVHGPQGMQFNPATSAISRTAAPTTGRRVLRGWLWGAAWGQWWTLWTIVSAFIWGHGATDTAFVLGMVIFAIVYAFFGSLSGIIIALANADIGTGAMIGIGAGLCCLGIEFLMGHDAAALVFNVIFYVITGRYIGARIARQVQAPVPVPALTQ